MKARFDFAKAAPDAYKAIAALDRYVVKESGLEPRLVHLIKLRASQINGCAYCVGMHSKEARRDGLSEQWSNMVCVGRESPVFDARERAVLGWPDAVTNVARTGAQDSAHDALRAHFAEAAITKRTTAIGLISLWTRLSVSFR